MKLLLKLIPALAFVLCLIFTPNIEASWRYFYNMPQQEEQTSFLLETFIYSSNYPSVDDAINDPNSSENVFDGSADFVIDSDTGEINIESTTKTTNVYFTVDFIYSLQQMGYTKIKLQNYSNDISIYDIVQNLFPDKSKDFVISINENDIALVKETKAGIDSKTIEKLASTIADTISGEFYLHVTIGIGTTVSNIKDLARSFKEAQAALEVGKVFDTEKTIVSYDNLGIARLIYQLPTTLCETFLKEVFKRGSIDSLDQETLFTIQRFFENNLNVSETSRKLFVHRNTLVYRLEKIKKITGLDLREFDHAIIFKIALMVNKYLKSNPIKY